MTLILIRNRMSEKIPIPNKCPITKPQFQINVQLPSSNDKKNVNDTITDFLHWEFNYLLSCWKLGFGNSFGIGIWELGFLFMWERSFPVFYRLTQNYSANIINWFNFCLKNRMKWSKSCDLSLNLTISPDYFRINALFPYQEAMPMIVLWYFSFLYSFKPAYI